MAREPLTQVGRALAELRIEHIPSYSPEGRGRMERLFGTLQNRLPPLLRLNGIVTIEAANRFLAETYIGEHNARFAVPAAEEGDAFVPFVGDLADILCAKHQRVVGNDNCVRYAGPSCRSPSSATAATSSRPASPSTNTRTARSPSSTARAGSPDTRPTAPLTEENQTRSAA